MEALLAKLIEISMIASWLILIILVLRICFKKASKSFYCFLWALVGLRLIFPFSIESVFSLIPKKEILTPTIQTGISVLNQTIEQNTQPETVIVPQSMNWMSILTMIWIIGIITLSIYSIISYYRLYKKVSISLPYKKNIYYCDSIDSPFILGIIQPKIYLPSTLNESQIQYVLKHEYAHLKRKDHLWKPLGFALLTFYWFNPMIWVAYITLCKDIESACDEYVIKKMDSYNKKMYSETLFTCSVDRKLIMACPLAFGEVGVKERIKSIVNYKKPTFWVLCASLVVCIVLSVGFLTEPKSVTDFTFTTGLLNKEIKLNNEQIDEVFNQLNTYTFNHKTNHTFDGQRYLITYNKDKKNYRWTITKEKTQLIINEDGKNSIIFVGNDPALLNGLKKYESLAQESIKNENQLNMINTNTTSLTNKIIDTILDYHNQDNPTGTIKTESHIVLASSQGTALTKDTSELVDLKYYLIVLYQEFSVVDNKPVEIYRSYSPTMITFDVQNTEYPIKNSVKEYWQPTQGENYQKDIMERFPSESANDAINSQKYLEELEKENLQEVNDYIKAIQMESTASEAFDEIYTFIKTYDNGYTDEDYNNAQGEKCLHPRGEYMNKYIPSVTIKIDSDPHCLFCYIVYISKDDQSVHVYIDHESHSKIEHILFDKGFERID